MKVLRGLYAITDEKLIPKDRFAETVEQALRGGARIIQYRDKSADKPRRLQQATDLKNLCEKYRAILIINDDVELALDVDADGIHIGKNDSTLAAARQRLGREKVIGVSCYNRLELAMDAKNRGADYVAFGSFFPSLTKPDAANAQTALLTRARQELNLPVCAIGGITLENAPGLIQTGADMVAVISDIFGNPHIQAQCEKFTALF